MARRSVGVRAARPASSRRLSAWPPAASATQRGHGLGIRRSLARARPRRTTQLVEQPAHWLGPVCHHEMADVHALLAHDAGRLRFAPPIVGGGGGGGNKGSGGGGGLVGGD